MNQNGRALVEQAHREAVERYHEQKQQDHELVETRFREALERAREQKHDQRAVVEQVHHRAIEQRCVEHMLPCGPPNGVHYTELPEAKPGESLAEEWNIYRREVGRWLAEGLKGRHVLMKGADVLGIYETSDEAEDAGRQRVLPQPCFVHPIRAEEPSMRIRGINSPWPS